MILTISDLKLKFNNIIDIKGKISRDIKKGHLFPIVRGVYETNSNVSGFYLSQYICGPSYLSFDYALYYYNLIPEKIYNTFTCATFDKRKIKRFENYFGTYIYRDVPKDVYHYGIDLIIDGEYSFHIATPEKALCDKLYTMTPIRSIKDLRSLLFDDLRIDEDSFYNLNKNDLLFLAPLYKSTNLNMLIKFLNK